MEKLEVTEITIEEFEQAIDDFLGSDIRVATAQFSYGLHIVDSYSRPEYVAMALDVLEEAPISSEDKIGIALEKMGYYVGIEKTHGYHDHEYVINIIEFESHSGKIYFSKIADEWVVDGWLCISNTHPAYVFSIDIVDLKTFNLLPLVHTILTAEMEEYLVIAINRAILDVRKHNL